MSDTSYIIKPLENNFITICAWCAPKGANKFLESGEVQVSHGICEECKVKHFDSIEIVHVEELTEEQAENQKLRYGAVAAKFDQSQH